MHHQSLLPAAITAQHHNLLAGNKSAIPVVQQATDVETGVRQNLGELTPNPCFEKPRLRARISGTKGCLSIPAKTRQWQGDSL
ncbi:MAG: hypothetical protein HC827_01575 [Cyanobacteria bacterium RM1_2_2]|nr:hypothetical protein [Cyanobacteria bacterium RM1_2_2]